MTIKNVSKRISDELRPEYDLSKLTGAVRGKYYERATAGTTLVLLEPDVADAYPDARTVNDILRAVSKLARSQGNTLSHELPNKTLQPPSRARRRSSPQKSPRAARG